MAEYGSEVRLDMKRRETWASDTLISRPEPPNPEMPVLVDFEGFGFSMGGLVHNISETEIEEMFLPTYAPEGFMSDVDQALGGPERRV